MCWYFIQSPLPRPLLAAQGIARQLEKTFFVAVSEKDVWMVVKSCLVTLLLTHALGCWACESNAKFMAFNKEKMEPNELEDIRCSNIDANARRLARLACIAAWNKTTSNQLVPSLSHHFLGSPYIVSLHNLSPYRALYDLLKYNIPRDPVQYLNGLVKSP